jgi:DNA-directed RNA polymerase specialized sigma24 family protein
MIFDCNYVTELVERWKLSHDTKLLEVILDQSNSLIEAIVSGYDSFYRDDLIQESRLKLQYSLPYFDKSVANLHTFFTTVIKNICLSYLRKQSRYAEEFPIDAFEYVEQSCNSSANYDILEDLIIRNRQRFPSIPVDIIDDASERLYAELSEQLTRRTIVKNLTELFEDRNIASVFYTSSLIYLRSKHFYDMVHNFQYDEFSLYKDLLEIFGKETTNKISIILAGSTIKFP